MDRPAPLLEALNLTITKGNQLVLGQVNLRLDPGDYACIYGRSGTGKTSLLRTLALLDKPAEGTIRIQGKDYANAPPRQQAKARNTIIGYIPQHDNLIPQLTIRENILLPHKIRGTPTTRLQDKLIQVATTLEIQDLLNRYPHQLSGGQRRRAIIARALVKDPKIIIADEPLTALDDQLAKKILETLNDHARQGTIVIHATPDTSEKPPCTKTYKIKNNSLINII